MAKVFSIDEVIAASYYILVVERSEPFENIEMVKLHDDLEKCPPFRKVTYRFRVLEQLLNKTGLPLKEEIQIVRANTSEDMFVHRKMHIEGTSKSIYRPEYAGGDFNSKRLIVFLNQKFELVADGAYEGIENKEKVTRVISDYRKGIE